ncbi:MAG: RNA methyltransferase [Bacteroidales bacterium]|nr:RNA methyltransferase [Bacteroidales bacterium]
MEISHNEIKFVRSLQQKKFREEHGVFVVEGEKMVQEALESGFKVEKVYRREELGEKAMERLSAMSSPSPVVAVVRMPEPAVPEVGGLCLALDSVRDPGNLGTILRIADWFGIDCIFASPDSADVYNPKVVQASMGAIFRKKVIYCDLTALCESFAKSGKRVFGTFLEGADIYASELPGEGLIVMGNEANGISPEVAAKVTDRITIPSFGGGAESLNVAVATAVAVSEFRRRCR